MERSWNALDERAHQRHDGAANMKLSFENDVRGRTVIDASGRSVGEVETIYVDGESVPVGLRVASLKLHDSVADALGIRHGTFHPATVEVPALAMQAFGDA